MACASTPRPRDQRDYEYFAAALAWTGDPKKMNGGGPIWAIFDADAVAREKWDVKPPHVDPDGYFFSADTIEELAEKIVNRISMAADAAGRRCARRSIATIRFVDTGVDADFKKPRPLHKIAKPPFYAAWHTPAMHDSYTGIRINTSGAGPRPARPGHPGPLCLRRFSRRLRPARHLPRGDLRPDRRKSRRAAGGIAA